jgi:hypothetical protein
MMTNRWAPMLAFLLAACGSSGAPATLDGGGEGGATTDAPAAPDAAGPDAATPDGVARDVATEAGPADAVVSGDAPTTAAVHFVLRNETGQTIYLQDNAFWTLWRDGKMVRANDTCEYCNCSGMGGCAVCGKALDVTLAIGPGATQAWEWSGYHWALKPYAQATPPLNLECEDPEAVGPGPLQVQVTYSLSKVDMPPGSLIGPAISLKLDFQHPPTADVVLVTR